MSAEGTPSPWLYDLRLRARNLRQGALEEAQLQEHLKSLPDTSDNAVAFEVTQPGLEESAAAGGEAG